MWSLETETKFILFLLFSPSSSFFASLIHSFPYLSSFSLFSLLFHYFRPSPSSSLPPSLSPSQHVFIPVLPGALIDFCCSPLPYLMGMHPSLIPALDEMETMEEVCSKCIIISQQLGSGKAKKVNYTQDSSFFSKKRRRAALGGIRTHNTLQSRQALYQLSYKRNSAGRGSC